MADAIINFVHPVTGEMRDAPIGFSWTTLFFGFFPALLRGHWVWAVFMFLLSALTFGLSWIVMPFIYNKIYARFLVNKGFRATGSTSDLATLERRISLKIPQA